MPAPNVKVIPARDMQPKVLRVAAYCRVSSDSADQLHSYAAQIRYYTDLINSKPEWELADIYADEARTGTRADKREDFQRLMTDCRNGKIDVVLVKSISRFARNTRDCLCYLRELNGLGISVRFEEENIDTKTLTSELMVSVFGSLAQQESMSISQNLRMSYQRRMEKGEFITCKPPYGYRMVDGKQMEIVPEEAAVICWIFSAYVHGTSMKDIANNLNARNLSTPDGSQHWSQFTIHYILGNEKYIGDSLCQKFYTTGLPFVQQRNRGEQAQYYITDTHPAIISKAVYAQAQQLRSLRLTSKNTVSYTLTHKIRCGHCGAYYIRKTTSTGYITWVCGKHNDNAAGCPNGRIPEAHIYAAFVRMYRKLKQQYEEILTPAVRQLERLVTISSQNNRKFQTLNNQIAQATDQLYKLEKLISTGSLPLELCVARQTEVQRQLMELRRKRQRLLAEDCSVKLQNKLWQIMEIIKSGPENLYEFDEAIFNSLVKQIVVTDDHTLRFQLDADLELSEVI